METANVPSVSLAKASFLSRGLQVSNVPLAQDTGFTWRGLENPVLIILSKSAQIASLTF